MNGIGPIGISLIKVKCTNQLEKFWRIWTHFAEKTPQIIIVSIQCFISIFHISMNIPEIATKKESLHISAKYDD